ncbi:MAG: hypothetical protein K6L76_12000 [Agarilytica sp.]
MKTVKQTAEYTIFLRNDKRYAVRSANRNWINGEDKVAILQKEELMKAPEPKPEAPVAEEAAESTEAAEEGGEA